MPVTKAGPRLYRSVPFKHLGKGSATGGARSSNISLNLVPFVDTMTILVCFLLMVFSSTGELLKAQKGLELPMAMQKDALQVAPIIIVTNTEVSFQGTQVATIDSLLRDERPTLKIEALFERLQAVGKKRREEISLGRDKRAKKACDDLKAGIVDPSNLCPEGLAILQADKETDARVITMIVTTAKYAEFDNILFAVKAK
ncbi:MAG: biopolymer transporter ExbD [Kofleriaceae bacterium]|nr:biopolymer transporter ExbD [Kofleriaceae bacterium]MCL4223341.1 biopolymer transporter ExbD [Myxococcales bacterium]